MQAGIAHPLRRRGPEDDGLPDAGRLAAEALACLPHGLAAYDATETLTLFNERLAEIYGLPEQALRVGMPLRDVVQACADAGCYPDRAPQEVYDEHAALLRDGRPAPLTEHPRAGLAVVVTFRRLPGGGSVAVYEDATERQLAQERFILMAHHDPLTKLANRDLLKTRFDALLAAPARAAGRLAVLCLDLDRFKQVNDSLGHAAGDALLRQVADRLRGATRRSDTVARTGGDEFTILQAGVAQPDGAAALARRLLDALRPPFSVDGAEISIGVSIGIALHSRDAPGPAEMLRNADVALYNAKAGGRGRYCFYDKAVRRRRRDRQAMENDLRAAIGTPAISLHYQPMVACADAGVTGFEALMRWTHPQRGLVPADVFIPLAEEAGLICPLGLWALTAACEEAASWPDRLKVSVNLSPAQLLAGDLHHHVADALRRSGLLAARLELEITERLLITDTEQASASLTSLRALGVGLALDDFGTGYSSLGYLQRFPFSRLKIDRAFVGALGQDSGADSIVQAIFAMSRSLYLSVTAEGVETPEQLSILCRQGCDEVQGYLLGRPMQPQHIPVYLATLCGGRLMLEQPGQGASAGLR